MDEVKTEGSPIEVGPAFTASAESAEHLDDQFSDDEPENEVEALRQLPPEERRKALRRLRNRESARRVRARRLAEVSQMGTTMQGLQDENTALKAHVNKLQSHIQSMTLKVYEVTGKYEAAVAENAQLRSELLRIRRPSAPGDSSFMAPSGSGPAAAAAAAAANGPNSAPLHQLSPFIAPNDLAAAGGQQTLTAGLAQLRRSSPMDLQQQRHALDEVVMLLKEHKRRHHGHGQDQSGCSEIGSCGAGGNNVTTTHSPTSEVPVAGAAGPPVSGLAASGLGTNGSTNGMPYNGGGNLSRFNMGGDVTGASSLGGLRGCQSDILMGCIQQPALHLPMHLQTNSHLSYGEHLGMCSAAVMANMHNMGQPLPHAHAPPLPQQLLGNSGPAPSLSLPLPTLQQQHLQQQHLQQQLQLPQQPQARGQSHSVPLELLQLPYHQQFTVLSQQQQQQMQASGQQAPGSMAVYGTMSSLSLSAPFYSAVSAMPHAGGGAGCGGGLQMISGHNSGPTALGSGVGGLGGNLPAAAAAGLGGGLGSNHRSASYALDRGTCLASAHNVAAIHPTWNGNDGAVGVAALRPEDLSEDILMSLDEYVPQDL